MKRNTFSAIFLMLFIFMILGTLALAEINTFIKEYTYQASEDDSRNSFQTLALREKTRELEEFRGRSDEPLRENERLKKELSGATGKERKKDTEAYKKTINDLSAIEWFEKAYASNISGSHKDAVDEYSKAIEINPKDAGAYYNRGATYISLGNYNQAIQDFSKAIEINPKYVWAYYYRGIVFGRLGDHNRALQDFDKVIEINPKDAMAYMNRGNASGRLGDHNRAIQDYNKAIELNPKDAGA